MNLDAEPRVAVCDFPLARIVRRVLEVGPGTADELAPR
jgi:hypothetical protein